MARRVSVVRLPEMNYRLQNLAAVLARLTMEEANAIRRAAGAGDVEAVAVVFERYGVPEAFLAAVAFVVARQEAGRVKVVGVRDD